MSVTQPISLASLATALVFSLSASLRSSSESLWGFVVHLFLHFVRRPVLKSFLSLAACFALALNPLAVIAAKAAPASTSQKSAIGAKDSQNSEDSQTTKDTKDPASCAMAASTKAIDAMRVGELKDLDARMRASDESCLDRTEFLEQRVLVSLKLGDLASALVWAEKRVMLDPDSPAALMDYAWVARLSDQGELARGILAQLIERPDLPSALRTQVTAWLEQPAGAGLRLVGGRTVVGFMAGYETNLNNGPSSPDIALTFPTGDYIYELDRSELARSGAVVSAYGQWTGQLARGLTQVGDLRVSAQARSPLVGGNDFATQVAEVNAGLYPGALGITSSVVPARLWSQLSQYGYGGTSLMTALSVGSTWNIGHSRELGVLPAALLSCSSQPGLWLEARRYSDRTRSDGDIVGANYLFGCADGGLRYQAEVFAVKDMASRDRLGGDTTRLGIGLSVQSAGGPHTEGPGSGSGIQGFLKARPAWVVYGRAERAKDRQGYSDLLDFGSPRRVSAVTLGGQISGPLDSDVKHRWVIRAEKRLQKSNIDIFDNESTTIGVGLEFALD